MNFDPYRIAYNKITKRDLQTQISFTFNFIDEAKLKFYNNNSVELEANITKLLYHYHKIGDFDSKSEDLFVLLKSTPDRYDFIDKVSHLVQELNL